MIAPLAAPLALHATALVLGEAGVLLRGPSGVGKSATALALIALARAQGLFARLVGDDRVLVEASGGRLIAAPHPRAQGLIERRFVGLETVPFEPRAVVALIVDLAPDAAGLDRLPQAGALAERLAGVLAPRLALPAGPHAAPAILARLREAAPRD